MTFRSPMTTTKGPRLMLGYVEESFAARQRHLTHPVIVLNDDPAIGVERDAGPSLSSTVLCSAGSGRQCAVAQQIRADMNTAARRAMPASARPDIWGAIGRYRMGWVLW